ncbi:hypothetical protein MMSR116_06045 [Methylobacterium mesophilicum SR1.6/6]|uniref:Uncharacterized protein n=1 Tax=Methylobacterium mesophilicum SR1.6/6 TaxID=908290 RepID=A0A6B9FK45_9HYPH|nr:hypothetical protein [Methylobacterium mesophilicum]QGY01515.1 hypothetical protein MMSR116_06045 [Methylobacterium mesophilicum SR1.6/6]
MYDHLVDEALYKLFIVAIELIRLFVCNLPDFGSIVLTCEAFEHAALRLIFRLQSRDAFDQLLKVMDLARVKLCWWHSVVPRLTNAIISQAARETQVASRVEDVFVSSFARVTVGAA